MALHRGKRQRPYVVRTAAASLAAAALTILVLTAAGCTPGQGTLTPSASSPTSAATTEPVATETAATPTPGATAEASATPVAFVSTSLGYTIVLPPGWVTPEPGAHENFFESPSGEVTLTMGIGQPEPGQTVEDRVRVNRAEEFGGCETDPAADQPVKVGAEPGILWSFRCGQEVGVAANTIHDGTGYRLILKATIGANDELEPMMRELLRDFAFTEMSTPSAASVESFRRERNAICQPGSADIAAINATIDREGATPSEAAAGLRQVADRIEQAQDELDELDVPPTLADFVAADNDRRTARVQFVHDLAAAIEAGDDAGFAEIDQDLTSLNIETEYAEDTHRLSHCP